MECSNAERKVVEITIHAKAKGAEHDVHLAVSSRGVLVHGIRPCPRDVECDTVRRLGPSRLAFHMVIMSAMQTGGVSHVTVFDDGRVITYAAPPDSVRTERKISEQTSVAMTFHTQKLGAPDDFDLTTRSDGTVVAFRGRQEIFTFPKISKPNIADLPVNGPAEEDSAVVLRFLTAEASGYDVEFTVYNNGRTSFFARAPNWGVLLKTPLIDVAAPLETMETMETTETTETTETKKMETTTNETEKTNKATETTETKATETTETKATPEKMGTETGPTSHDVIVRFALSVRDWETESLLVLASAFGAFGAFGRPPCHCKRDSALCFISSHLVKASQSERNLCWQMMDAIPSERAQKAAVGLLIEAERKHRKHLKNSLGIFLPPEYWRKRADILGRLDQPWQERAASMLELCIEAGAAKYFSSIETMNDWFAQQNAEHAKRVAVAAAFAVENKK